MASIRKRKKRIKQIYRQMCDAYGIYTQQTKMFENFVRQMKEREELLLNIRPEKPIVKVPMQNAYIDKVNRLYSMEKCLDGKHRLIYQHVQLIEAKE